MRLKWERLSIMPINPSMNGKHGQYCSLAAADSSYCLAFGFVTPHFFQPLIMAFMISYVIIFGVAFVKLRNQLVGTYETDEFSGMSVNAASIWWKNQSKRHIGGSLNSTAGIGISRCGCVRLIQGVSINKLQSSSISTSAIRSRIELKFIHINVIKASEIFIWRARFPIIPC